jgi:ribosomal protein S18 acetylase RimI-like enzyme
MISTEQIVQQVYSINSFYVKQKIMGPYFKGWIKGALEKNKIEFIEKDGEVIAFMTYSILKKKPLITLQKLAVKDEHRRAGYGKTLLNCLKVKALNGKQTIQLRVAKINESAIAFYKSQGFLESDDNKHDYSIRMTWSDNV